VSRVRNVGRWLLLALGCLAASVKAESVKPVTLPADHAAFVGRGTNRNRITEADRAWWAFKPLASVTPPAVKNEEWVRTPVDRFILARWEAAGLKPNPEADRRVLGRRAAMDLTGLPPTESMLDAWLEDREPGAWERWVARLLASPAHGERWARHWLDVARFAESSGFEHDYDRPGAYHFRDFVVRALNADMPYDQFVRWQLAGDEYEPENPLALMATGFLGAGVFPTQITANEVERTRYDAMDDMLSTTGVAFLGLTVGCARCHDHKFDPIPASDYYRMLATFTTTVRSELELDLDPEGTRRAQAVHAAAEAPLKEALIEYERDALPSRWEAWLKGDGPRKVKPGWEVLSVTDARSAAGAGLRPLGDGSFLAEGKNGDTDVYTFEATSGLEGVRALRVEALAHPTMNRGGPGRADNANIGLSRIRAWVSPVNGGPSNEVRFATARATFEQNPGGLSVKSALDADRGTGWAVDPKFGMDHAAVFECAEPLGYPDGTRWFVRLEFGLNTRHNIGRPRLSVATDPGLELKGSGTPAAVAAALEHVRTGKELTETERDVLKAWWKTSDPGWQAVHERLEAHRRAAPTARRERVLVCAEGYPAVRMHTQGADFFPETHFLQRGSTDQKRGVVRPGFLEVLLRGSEERWQKTPEAGARFSNRRRALAEWITDAERGAGHLAARVIVNRLWQHHFGQGLVATSNDFGTQGSRPSHPELLDWLAGELIRGGWRLKPIHQLIVSSAVYRQSSAVDTVRRDADPSNTWWSRWTPRRLEGEALRDAMLAVSGVLDPAMYGPGTFDPGSRRRSLYFTIKRSRLVPDMVAFDAPEPLVSQGRRPVTTVAPQALVLLNGPHVRVWAEALAQRAGAGAAPEATVVGRMYRLLLQRDPTPDEREAALGFLKTGRVPDLAQVLFSLDEFAYLE